MFFNAVKAALGESLQAWQDFLDRVAAACQLRRGFNLVERSVALEEFERLWLETYEAAKGARGWLDRVMAGRLPKPGRLALSPMLSEKGRLIGDFTVSCLDDSIYHLTASYGAQDVHSRWFDLQGARAADLEVENISDSLTGFQIAGPRAGDLLARVAGLGPGAMRFRDVRYLTIGLSRCLVQQVSYTGDLGYEIYVDAMEQRALWNALWDAGQPMGITPFGMRAMMSLRLDKFFGGWLLEFSPDYTAAETGLDRFISFKKNVDFIGRAAAEAERATRPDRQLCAFDVDAHDADVVAYEPIFVAGEVRGFCTSGGYSHHAGKSIALGLVPRDMAQDGLAVEIEILGKMRQAQLITPPLFDADGTHMRG